MPLGSIDLKPHARPTYFSHYFRVSKQKLTFFSTRESNLLYLAVKAFCQFMHIMIASNKLVASRDEDAFFLSITTMTLTGGRPQVGSDIMELGYKQ